MVMITTSSSKTFVIILLFLCTTKILLNGIEAFSATIHRIRIKKYDIKTTICKHNECESEHNYYNNKDGSRRRLHEQMRLSTSKISSQEQQQKLSNFHNIAARTIFQTYRSSNSRISTKKIKVVLKFIISSILFLSLSQSTMIKSAISATATTTTSIPTNSIISLSPMSMYKKIILSKMTLKKIGVMLSLLFTTFLTWETYKVQKRQATDATSEWSRYANNPSARGRAIMLLLVKLLPYTILARISKPKYAHELRTKSGEVAAQNLLQLGPLYIKIGQILSCREDLFSPEWNTALERLQDRVPAQSGEDAIQLAYESFGSKERIGDSLSNSDNVPIAIAEASSKMIEAMKADPSTASNSPAGPLAGKVAVITGASSGIGRAIVVSLVQAGCHVAMGARRMDELEKTRVIVAESCQGCASKTICVSTDVTKREQVKSLIETAESSLGPVDILVNVAGCMYFTLMKNAIWDQWEQQVDVNAKGTMYCIGTVLPKMLTRGKGHIVNITSDAGRKAFAGLGIYSGTKYFIEAVSQALRLETASTGLRVTCIQPGNVETPLLSKSTDPEGLEEYGTPSGAKVLEPEDIARAVVYALTQPEWCAVNEILVEPREEPA